MNKTDLKKLRIDDRYVIEPLKFLISIGVASPELEDKITIQDLHYILHDKLHHAGIKSVSADKVYRGDIVLIGKPNKFYPYYNPIRTKVSVSAVKIDEKKQEVKVVDLKVFTMIELYRLYQETLELKYLNEIYDRTYENLKAENAPTKRKIYSHLGKLA